MDLRERVLEKLAAARAGLDEEAVHQLRVSIRRWQAALRVLGAPRDVRQAMRPLMQAAGAVRNLDIAGGLAREAGCGEVAGQLADQREAAAMELRALVASVDVPVFAPEFTPEQAKAKPVSIRALVKAVYRLGRKAAWRPTAERLHALRLAGKRLRYAIEFRLADLDATAPARLKELKALQDALGAVNDCVSARTLVADAAFHAYLDEREQASRESFAGCWRNGFRALGAWEAWRALVPEPREPGGETAVPEQ